MDVDLDTHLSYPLPEPITLPPSSSTSAPARPLLKERLYVGNLHPTVDEYTLIRLFQRYGKVTRLDFLFHKAGPHRGKPRGYAFVEYASAEEATNALTSTHDRLLRGRRLVVTHAQHAPADGASHTHRPQHQPTALSIIKSAQARRSGDKIAQMEAKLRQMGADDGARAPSLVVSARAPPAEGPPESPHAMEERDATQAHLPSQPHPLEVHSSQPHPAHPSLPAKPPPTLESVLAPRAAGDTSVHPTRQRPVGAAGLLGSAPPGLRPAPTTTSKSSFAAISRLTANATPMRPTIASRPSTTTPMSRPPSTATSAPRPSAAMTLARPSAAGDAAPRAPPAKKKQGLVGVKIVKKKT
ncbi:hypothetical protein HDZ31DRAFT_36851 [Schizophyllum fasciatum]